VRAGDPAVWLQTYRPHLYAGLQVAMQCFGSCGTLVNPGAEASPDDVVAAMVRNGVECASATPSYWRRLLIFGDKAALRSVRLRQITLGGELVDQQVLDMLKETFPGARLVHIYATTELGRCFSVTDAQAGFPARFVGPASPDGVELRVDDGELFVRSANAMQGYDANSGAPPSPGQSPAAPRSQWFPTGDLVRLEGDRYFFVGRKSDIINVGGNKVSPQEVEPVLRAVPGVAEVRVYARRSSVAGQLVAAQIVPQAGADPDAVKAAAIQAGVSQLLPHQRPRLVEIVDCIELSEAGKVVRR
jgi:acyl-CoA synthetase (AMP-forming)/AMP-acid ligase II